MIHPTPRQAAARKRNGAAEITRVRRFAGLTGLPEALWQNALEGTRRYAEAARLVARELGRSRREPSVF
jgi:hypothetical protein